MNLLSIIQSALTALNSSADAYLFEKSRDENEALEYENPVIVIFPTWSGPANFSQSSEIYNNITYEIDFKTQDEFDNSDDLSDSEKNYSDRSTAERIREMTILANSVFWYINANKNDFGIENNLEWTTIRPIVRENNGTMSGVKISLTINFKGSTVCDYNELSPPTYGNLSYSQSGANLTASIEVTNNSYQELYLYLWFRLNDKYLLVAHTIPGNSSQIYDAIFENVNRDNVNELYVYDSELTLIDSETIPIIAPFEMVCDGAGTVAFRMGMVKPFNLFLEEELSGVETIKINNETNAQYNDISKVYSLATQKRIYLELNNKINYLHFSAQSTLILSGDELIKLVNLNYFYNFIGNNFNINGNVFGKLVNLTYLYFWSFSGNPFTINTGEIANLTELTFLYLRASSNVTIGENEFLQLQHLRFLFLRDLGSVAFGVNDRLYDLANITIFNCNLSANSADNIIINLDNEGKSNGTLNLTNNNGRTSLSDTAYNNLIVKGWTITL